MKSIYNLIPDIYSTISSKNGWFTDELARDYGSEVARRLQVQLGEARPSPTLRLSQMGPKCPKALWHSIHTPHLAVPLPPQAEIKYSFGHMIEALAITLAKASGHSVTGEQDEVVVDGIRGHRDCVIDGRIVDVKSCSSRAFQKIKRSLLANDDSFGYLDQLDGYLAGSQQDDLVVDKGRAYILAIDKTLGHMHLHEHEHRPGLIEDRIREYRRIVELPEPPKCECGTRPMGQSGNIELDVRASYSPFKFECFPHLRVFLYSDGPTFLTEVVKRPAPHIVEIDKRGYFVYNYEH